MAWLFLPGGLLMPSSIPQGGSDGTVDPKWLGSAGDFDIQVRGRVRSHLENFIRDYLDPMGLDYSDIQETPEMDYNVRFYMRQNEFAQAVAQAMMDINYLKFKPTAEWVSADTGQKLFKDGAAYHTVLNAIWGAVCHLGSPGGGWGAYSKTNPAGYKSAAESPYVTDKDEPLWRTGDSFRNAAGSGSTTQRDRDAEWWDTSEDDGWTPQHDDDVQAIIDTMDGIPLDQWEEFLADWEFNMVKPFMAEVNKQRAASTRRENRRERRQNRKTTRKQSNYHR